MDGRLFKIHIDEISKKFRAAADEVGRKDLRFHDLRHEATSRLFESGKFRDLEIAAITGHKTLGMLKRYTHFKVEELAMRMG
jgi:integrase